MVLWKPVAGGTQTIYRKVLPRFDIISESKDGLYHVMFLAGIVLFFGAPSCEGLNGPIYTKDGSSV